MKRIVSLLISTLLPLFQWFRTVPCLTTIWMKMEFSKLWMYIVSDEYRRNVKMLRKKTCLLLCIAMIAGIMFGCQAPQKENPEDFLADIEIGMTLEEGRAILGEPLLSFSSGPLSDTYVISDTHIAIAWYSWKHSPSDDTWFCIKKEILTYDEFSEHYTEERLEMILDLNNREKNG